MYPTNTGGSNVLKPAHISLQAAILCSSSQLLCSTMSYWQFEINIYTWEWTNTTNEDFLFFRDSVYQHTSDWVPTLCLAL